MRARQIVTIARFTLLEAGRIRIWHLFAVLLIMIFAAAWFVQQLAITESARLATAFAAASIRIAAVFVLSLHVLTSIGREFNDKGLELTLSFDVRRSDYVVGRVVGFMLAGVVIATLATLPQFLLAPTQSVMQWGFSLACELAIMGALSLFCIMTFTQLMPATSFVLAFYLLTRTLTAIRLMDASPLTGVSTLSHQFISRIIEILALVLPALDHYTQSAWLSDGSVVAWSTFLSLVVQSLLYVMLLGAAAAFDFQRRNL